MIETHGVGRIASVVGRYYAMDRDRRWERTRMAFDLLVTGTGEPTTDPIEAVQARYEAGMTDEFMKPIVVLDDAGEPTVDPSRATSSSSSTSGPTARGN